MKIFAQITAVGNLLALLAFVGALLFLLPLVPVQLLAAGLIGALGLAVFSGQRCYARFIAQERPEAPQTEGPFVPLPEWRSGQSCPGLLAAGNMIFAAAVIALPYLANLSYHQFLMALNGYDPHFAWLLTETGALLNPHPLYYFLWGALVFLAVVVSVNILFNLACLVAQWPPRLTGRALSRRGLAGGIGGLILLVLIWLSYGYVLDQGRTLVRRAVWPQFETVTLDDGQTIEVAPPPGYFRIEPDHPALKKYLFEQRYRTGDRGRGLVAIFVANQRTYDKIIKNLESGASYHTGMPGLAWIERSPSQLIYTVDPSLDLSRRQSWGSRPDPPNSGNEISAPDFSIHATGHQYIAFGNEVVNSGTNVGGQVIVGNSLLTTMSVYFREGGTNEKQLRRLLDDNRRWLRALSGWQPPPPARPCPGRPTVSGLQSRFVENFKADLLATWEFKQSSSSLVTALAYNWQKSLVVGRISGDIEIWDLSKENTKRIISQAHSRQVTEISFTPDGKRFFSVSPWQDSVKLWDSETGELQHSLPGFTGPVLPVGRGSLYLAVKEHEVNLFDSRRKDQPGPDPGWDRERRKAAENRCPAINRLGIENRKNGRPNLEAARPCYRLGARARVLAADEAGGLVAVGTDSGSIDLFRVMADDQNPALTSVQSIQPYDSWDGVIGLYFAPDSETLYSVSRNGQIDEWSLPTLSKKRSLESSVSLNSLNSAKFLPGAGLLALVGTNYERGAAGPTINPGRFIELIHLSSGQSILRPAITDSARFEFIAPLSQVIAVQGNLVSVIDLPESFCP